MEIKEIREMSTDSLLDELDTTREGLMRLRFQQATGELVDHNQIRYSRRTIARILTVLDQREKTQAKEGEA
ncbi:MAG: 50S ribosomal protein L29 [Anaerolineales bacterium]|nr:50S ribosomal protein L29 [Anaerolineales bacterium]